MNEEAVGEFICVADREMPTDSTDGVKEGPLQRAVLAAEIRSIRGKQSVGSFLRDFANNITKDTIPHCENCVTALTITHLNHEGIILLLPTGSEPAVLPTAGIDL